MPYTKSGIFYTAKPTISGTGTKARYGGGYMGGPKYQPGYYRGSATGPAYKVMPYKKGSPETKYFDTSFSQTVASAADWTGTEVPCTNYIQSDGTTLGAYTDSALIPSAIGSGYGQVQGSKYNLKKIRVKGAFAPTILQDQADVPTPSSVRLILVLDTMPQGAQAQGEAVFTDMGTSTQANFSFLAMGAGTGARFRILKDKLFTLNPAAVGTDGASTLSAMRNGVNFKLAANLSSYGSVNLKANSSTPTVASLSNCNIFLLAHCNTGNVTILGCARTYYYE